MMSEAELRARLDALRIEHRGLDSAINVLMDENVPDQLRLARLKKQKLRLRDEMTRIEGLLIPDILA